MKLSVIQQDTYRCSEKETSVIIRLSLSHIAAPKDLPIKQPLIVFTCRTDLSGQRSGNPFSTVFLTAASTFLLQYPSIFVPTPIRDISTSFREFRSHILHPLALLK